jgi:integrative and conjugative element protein (TIGR02256 family)
MKYLEVLLTTDAMEKGPRLIVTADALRTVEKGGDGADGKETGGVLIGFHEGKDIRVVKASDAGPNAQRSACGFLRDTAYCQGMLDREHSLSGADYVGEWHTHVIDLPHPSEGDLLTLASIILDPDYNFPSFSMLLVVKRPRGTEIQGYMVTAEGASSQHSSARKVQVARVVPVIQESDR